VFMKGTQGLRRMGSAAIDLAYTACGRFDAFFEMNLSPWDIAAGMLLVKEAGGEVCDFKGGDSVLFGQEIIACSAHLFPEFFPAVSAHLKD
jgi:myo-inositol-1(or 4)-monophosphatase